MALMDSDELAQLHRMMYPDEGIEAYELGPWNRTLLVGTVVGVGTGVHIYLMDGQIHRLLHRDGRLVEHAAAKKAGSVRTLVNGLQARPEWTDFGFAVEVIKRGGRIKFNHYADVLYQEGRRRDFHGPLREELQ